MLLRPRIEPENNLDIILKAFIKTDIQLIIVENWNNSSYGKTLRTIPIQQLLLLDPIYEQMF